MITLGGTSFMKMFKWLFLTVASVFSIALAIVLTLGYVNDHRVDLPDWENFKKSEQFYVKSGSVLSSEWAHGMDMRNDEWARVAQEIKSTIKQTFIVGSKRFTSPFEVFISLGSYPTKLDGRDSILIPGGKEFWFAPQTDGEASLQFAAIAVGEKAEVLVQVDGINYGSLNVAPLDEPRSHLDAHYRRFTRYRNVNEIPPGGTWQMFRKEVTINKDSTVRLKCASAKGQCIVSDPAVFNKQNRDHDNVLMIVVDTLRGDAITAADAPFMHEFVKKSTVFNNAIAPGNMTAPSTNAFLSCRKPSDIRDVAFAYMISDKKREEYYREGMNSFPAVFEQNHFQTAMIGNVSLISEAMGIGVSHGAAQVVSTESEGYETPHAAREALNWLADNANKQFFLYLHFNAPHAAYRAPLEDIFATYPGMSGFRSRADFLKWMYRAEVHFTDRYVKQVVQSLDKLGIAKTTKIVLTGDHGDQFAFHDFKYNTAAKRLTGAFFDHGATLLQDEVHVPLIYFDPNRSGKEIQDFVQVLDIGPTLLDGSRLATPEWCQGKSLMSYIEGAPANNLAQRTLGVESFQGRGIVWDNRYKYVRSYTPVKKILTIPDRYTPEWTEVLIPEQLYDLKNDPNEEVNLAVTQPDMLDTARVKYDDYYLVLNEYQLVMESDQPVSYRIWIDGKPQLILPDGARSHEFAEGVRVLGDFKGRLVLRMHNFPAGKLTVNFNEAKRDILMTSLALPIDVNQVKKMPAERNLTKLDGPVVGQRVILRKAVFDELGDRSIQKVNSEFEAVLREWGYLNDNS